MSKPFVLTAFAVSSLLLAGSALAAEALKGEVLKGGAPIADSIVTLWAAGPEAPKELGRARTDAEGRFELSIAHPHGGDTPLYLVAQGGTPTTNKAGGAQPCHRAADGAGQQATGQGRDQRDDDHRLGMDA